MPKEVIYGMPRNPVDVTDPENPKPVQHVPGSVELHWDKAADAVNLYTVCVKDGDDGGPPILVGGGWVELDRAGLNKLIRDLRRARNAVFGSDE